MIKDKFIIWILTFLLISTSCLAVISVGLGTSTQTCSVPDGEIMYGSCESEGNLTYNDASNTLIFKDADITMYDADGLPAVAIYPDAGQVNFGDAISGTSMRWQINDNGAAPTIYLTTTQTDKNLISFGNLELWGDSSDNRLRFRRSGDAKFGIDSKNGGNTTLQFLDGTSDLKGYINVDTNGNMDINADGNISINNAYKLPLTDGSADYLVKTDGAGQWSYVNSSDFSFNPAGADTHVQFNDGGSFGGSSAFTFDKTTGNTQITSLSATGIPLTIKEAASQTGLLFQTLDSSGNVNFFLSPAGYMGLYHPGGYYLKFRDLNNGKIGVFRWDASDAAYKRFIFNVGPSSGTTLIGQHPSLYIQSENLVGANDLLFSGYSNHASSNMIFEHYRGADFYIQTRGALGNGNIYFRPNQVQNFGLYKSGTGKTAQITGGNANDVTLTVKGAASQSADYINVIDSSSAEKFVIDYSGNVETIGAIAVGTNTLEGLSAGDINVSTLYYDTLIAKSPTFTCNRDKNWCKVEYPEYQKELYIKHDGDYNIEIVRYNGNYYTQQEFIQNFCQGTGTVADICNDLKDKILYLRGKKLCNNQDGSYEDGVCYAYVYINVDYDDAVESYQKEIINITQSNCTRLNETNLRTYQGICNIEINTGIYETKYRFKEGCEWTEQDNYQCISKTEI